MLKQLYIKNFTLIDELNISLYPGFSVITGETGAGKSIILGAIGLLLGNRADSKAIKAGRDRCVIEAHFDLSRYGMQKFFDDNDIDYDADDTIIRRELTAAGKSRAFINDTPVPLTRMRELGEQLVDIHSQHQNLLLQKEDFQLNVVDIIAQDADQIKVYQKEYYAYRKAKELLEELKAEIAKNRENEEFMRFQHKELDDANLQEGELEQLEQEAETLSHSEDIKTALFEADNALSGENDSILDKLKNATHQLENICDVYPSMADVAGRMQSSYIELKDIAQEISSSVDHVEFDPNRLDAINTRLDKLYTLQQKFHVETVTELIATRDRIAEQLSHIDNGDEDIEEKEKEVAALLAKAEKQAALLTSIRQKSAKAIEKEMKGRLIPLGIPNVRFEIAFAEKPLSGNGADKVSFLFSANKSTQLQPVSQVASGGEIARVMLSLKAMISGAVKLPTIIFDEIDTGVSGRASQKIGLKLKSVSKNTQVICVTHSAQIASNADEHFLIQKKFNDNKTFTCVTPLDFEGRKQELARIMGGLEITDTLLQSAEELLNQNLCSD